MKFFKIQASRTATRYEITRDNFEKATENRFPYESKDVGGKISQYGICPSCLNPVRLIGLVKEIKVNPYGKHTGKTIQGVAKWNQNRYEYCPYAKRSERRIVNEDDLLSDITEDIIELYEMLIDNFDRVEYILFKELDISFSSRFLKESIKQYCNNQAYLYPTLTEVNLPYIFAYRGMTHNGIYGQSISVDSDLFKALEKHRYVRFDKTQNDCFRKLLSQNGYLNLELRFTGHQQKALQGERLVESMMFCVDDRTTGETVFQKHIEFDETYFMNIVNKGNEEHRNQYLLDLAKTSFPTLS